MQSEGQLGIFSAPKLPLTEPEVCTIHNSQKGSNFICKGFKFVTEERALGREAKVEELALPQFKARELDRSIFDGPVRFPYVLLYLPLFNYYSIKGFQVKGVPRKEPTVPESPQLATKFRSKLYPAPPPAEEPFVFKVCVW